MKINIQEYKLIYYRPAVAGHKGPVNQSPKWDCAHKYASRNVNVNVCAKRSGPGRMLIFHAECYVEKILSVTGDD